MSTKPKCVKMSKPNASKSHWFTVCDSACVVNKSFLLLVVKLAGCSWTGEYWSTTSPKRLDHLSSNSKLGECRHVSSCIFYRPAWRTTLPDGAIAQRKWENWPRFRMHSQQPTHCWLKSSDGSIVFTDVQKFHAKGELISAGYIGRHLIKYPYGMNFFILCSLAGFTLTVSGFWKIQPQWSCFTGMQSLLSTTWVLHATWSVTYHFFKYKNHLIWF